MTLIRCYIFMNTCNKISLKALVNISVLVKFIIKNRMWDDWVTVCNDFVI